MTAPQRSVTQHLRRAESILEKGEQLSADDIKAVADAIEAAMAALQITRAAAVAALDGL